MDNMNLQTTRERWYEAFFAGDITVMDRLEADIFRVVNAHGTQTKREQLDGILAAVAAGQWFPPGTCKQDSDVVTQTVKDLSIISGQGLTLVGGAREMTPIRFSEVWHQHGSEWQVLHLHYSVTA